LITRAKSTVDRRRSTARSRRKRAVDVVLVLAAWEPELAALRAALKVERSLARRVVARPAGVGLVEAGIGAARAIDEVRPRAVVFVGTAGAYGRTHAVASAVVAGKLTLASTAALRGDGYLPAPLPTVVESDRGLRRELGGPVGDVVCPLAITKTRALARRLAASGELENLEAFAVARAAGTVPFAAVLGVSNAVGPAANAEWRRHAGSAAAAACEVVLAWLRAPTRRPRRAR
jgi:nucleoside phosphorylase